MNSKWLKLSILALVIGLLAFAAVTYAQGPGGRGGFGGPDQSLVAVAAEVIGIDQTELVAQLNSGLTIAEVAEANDVSLEAIVSAFLAPRAERMAAAVESGWMTQEQADAMLAQMSETIRARLSAPSTPQGFGFMYGGGMMHGQMGMHGMGGFMHGYGMGFVDADGDGLCDNCAFNQGFGPGMGYGPGWGHRGPGWRGV